jgi:hypothetical protein
VKSAARDVIGRTVAHLVITRSVSTTLAHLFLVFADGTYYEFYSDSTIQPLTETPGALVGETIQGVDIISAKQADASILVLAASGTTFRFASESEIRATSTFWTDGLIGALGHFPDDVVLAQFGSTPVN